MTGGRINRDFPFPPPPLHFFLEMEEEIPFFFPVLGIRKRFSPRR